MSQTTAFPDPVSGPDVQSPPATQTDQLGELQLQVKRQQMLIRAYERAIRNICHDLVADMERGGIPESYRSSVMSLRVLIANDDFPAITAAIDSDSKRAKALVAEGCGK